MLLAHGPARRLGGGPGARLDFPKTGAKRLMLLDERPAFELSFWCGTCPFLFERLEGANGTLSLDALSDRLARGVLDLDAEVIDRFAALLPADDHVPLLLEIAPRLVRPSQPGDYFGEEQVATWGIDRFWDLPENPHTPYYRTFETTVADDARLYEFVVPMVPPSWNDAARVAAHGAALEASAAPTAVALSTLDVCAPAVEQGPDWHVHCCLTHFLLDGHHKLQAAAERGLPLRLLALVAVGSSLATAEDVARLPDLRARAADIHPKP
jgi:hypothetical protein